MADGVWLWNCPFCEWSLALDIKLAAFLPVRTLAYELINCHEEEHVAELRREVQRL